MTEALVQRLEEHAGSAVHHWEDWANRSDTLLREAAAEIERLTRERDEARRDKAALVAALKPLIPYLQDDVDYLVNEMGLPQEWKADVRRITKLIEKARAALANMEGKNDG